MKLLPHPGAGPALCHDAVVYLLFLPVNPGSGQQVYYLD